MPEWGDPAPSLSSRVLVPPPNCGQVYLCTEDDSWAKKGYATLGSFHATPKCCTSHLSSVPSVSRTGTSSPHAHAPRSHPQAAAFSMPRAHFLGMVWWSHLGLIQGQLSRQILPWSWLGFLQPLLYKEALKLRCRVLQTPGPYCWDEESWQLSHGSELPAARISCLFSSPGETLSFS